MQMCFLPPRRRGGEKFHTQRYFSSFSSSFVSVLWTLGIRWRKRKNILVVGTPTASHIRVYVEVKIIKFITVGLRIFVSA